VIDSTSRTAKHTRCSGRPKRQRPPTRTDRGVQGDAEKRLAQYPPGVRLNVHLTHDGEDAFRHACKMGLEGIVSKHGCIAGGYRRAPLPADTRTGQHHSPRADKSLPRPRTR
jgi:hypothetical protein